MNAHDGGIRTRWFAEPISVAERYAASVADLPMLVAGSRARQERQAAEARLAVERLLESVFGGPDGR